jgi:mannitol-1-phosphate 5-dehydrogenase
VGRSAVQFGAGNIGRGFLAQLFTESSLEVVFVDVSSPLVEALNARRSYSLHIVGDRAETIEIQNVRAVHGADREAVAREIAKAEIICTAVGASALPHIAPTLAAGLIARALEGGKPINILLCENLHDAASRLRGLVAEHLPSHTREQILARTGFVQAVVSRMVPIQTDEERAQDLLAVRAEGYKHLPVDAAAFVDPFPNIVGVEPTFQFEAMVERKLYTHNCAHAVLGYLGCMAGHRYGYEALEDGRIASLLRAVLAETSDALIRKHGFSRETQDAHVQDLSHRFRNRALGDTCLRLARDPMRKLAGDDRLVGAARLCESQNVKPRALAWAIVAALRHSDPDDPSSCEVQRLVRDLGRDAAIKRICGISPDEPLAALVREAFEATEPFPAWKVQ